MVAITRNKNNDIFLNDLGNISLSEDLTACLQTCEAAVSTMLKEQIYNQEQGVPNFSSLWNGVPNYKQAELAIRTIIESIDNVIEVTDFSYVVENNNFSYNATIKTVFGIGVIYNGL